MSMYDSLLKGLDDAIEYEKGNLALRTRRVSLAEPEDFSPERIKAVRAASGMSQTLFAAAMGVSKKAVEAWERGRTTPSGTARRLLALTEADPCFFQRCGILRDEPIAPRRREPDPK